MQVNSSGGNCEALYIVEKKAMVREITADEIRDTLNRRGFIALYINFATNKATIRPESQSIVDHIASMLRENSEMRRLRTGLVLERMALHAETGRH